MVVNTAERAGKGTAKIKKLKRKASLIQEQAQSPGVPGCVREGLRGGTVKKKKKVQKRKVGKN